MPNTCLTTFMHRNVATVAVLLLVVGAASAGAKKAKTAPSSGNDQTTFTMTLNATTCPFCNTTETVGDPSDARSIAAAHLPALIAPGVCGLASARWELNQDPFLAETFDSTTKLWQKDEPNKQNDDWNSNVVSGLYIPQFSDFRTTVSAAVTAGDQTAILAASPDQISKSIQVGDLVVIDDVGRELATVTKIGGNKISIRAGGKNSGWQSSHVKDVPFRVVAKKSECEAGKAEILLDRAFQSGFCAPNAYNLGSGALNIGVLNKTFEKNQSDFYVVNVVVWKKSDTDYSSSSSNWYVYNRGDHGHWYRQALPYFNGTLRVYGSKKPIGLIAIHVRANNDATPPWSDFQKLGIKYTISVKSKTPANVSDLQTALSIISGNKTAQAQAGLPDPDGFYGTMLFTAKAAADITITAEVDFSKLAPADQQHKPPDNPSNPAANMAAPAGSKAFVAEKIESSTTLPSDLRPKIHAVNYVASAREYLPTEQEGSGQQPQTNDQKPSTTKANQNNQKTQTPQNPSVDCQPGTNGKQSPCKFVATINDEDLYHWDVSFAVPFHSISELQYSQPSGNGNSIVPKNVTTLDAYAFFQVYPVASDIVTPPIISVPHVFAGLPISGKVFNKPMFGAGDTFNFTKVSFLKFIPIQFGFFGGVIYNKQFNQIPGTTGQSNVVGHRVWKGSYGIEIPVTQFKSLLSSKSSKSSSTSNNTGTTKTGN